MKGKKVRYLMLFCHFDEKNSKKLHSKLLKTLFCFYHGIFFNVSGTRTVVSITILFEKAKNKKPIFQGFISQILLIKKQGVKSFL